MPTEYFSYAYDLDGDGKKDLWNSVPDALASAAKQLKDKGWVTGLPWGFEVVLSPSVDCSFEGPARARRLADWAKLGFRRVAGPTVPPRVCSPRAAT